MKWLTLWYRVGGISASADGLRCGRTRAYSEVHAEYTDTVHGQAIESTSSHCTRSSAARGMRSGGGEEGSDVTDDTGSTQVDDYIAQAGPEVAPVLSQIRALIAHVAPDATETMSYGIPTFDLHGEHLIHFAGFKKHVGLYPTPSGIAAFKDELNAYKHAKGSVQFPLGEPLPSELIRRIAEFRVREVLAKRG